MAGMSPLELQTRRQGDFDGYTIYGHMYKFHGERRTGWYVTSVSTSVESRQYWVEHDQFHTVVSHIATPPTGANRFDIGEVTEVKEVERTVIARAIEQWTREYHDKILAES
jgi:hypothetical protein